jgi:hypothetical protein
MDRDWPREQYKVEREKNLEAEPEGSLEEVDGMKDLYYLTGIAKIKVTIYHF